MSISEYLTKAHSDQQQAWIEQTPPGAAHWAGTGPDGKTCRECAFMFDDAKRARRVAGALVSRTCTKRERITGQRSKVVPHTTPACRYFEQYDKPPVAMRARRKKNAKKSVEAR